MKLSVVVSAYNEEKNIKECLESVSFADEIILVNNSSSDKTEEIARKYTSKIFTRPNNIMLNVNKNFGFTKAQGDWILSLDADERVSPGLVKEIKSAVKRDPKNAGFWIPRKNIIFGKWIENDMWWPDYQLRLFKKGYGRFPEKHVHEYLKVRGDTEKLRSPLIHQNYKTVDQYIYKMLNIYVPSEVKNRQNIKVGWIDSLRYPVNDFLKTFFLQKGYKDGLHGLVLSLLQAFYMEIVFVKLWERQGFNKENPRNFLTEIHEEFKVIKKEFGYWFLTSWIRETKNPFKKIFLRLKRKRNT